MSQCRQAQCDNLYLVYQMKLKKLYKYDNNKQIWRILPTLNKKVVIEERNPNTKEVFFSCLDINSGKKIFSNLQLEEKNWLGIEAVYKDIIFFHSYGSPEMPAHKSIIAFDILSKSVLWKNENYVFSFIIDDKVYSYQQRFESRYNLALDYLTGEIVEEPGNDYNKLNQLKEKSDQEFFKHNYQFPEYFIKDSSGDELHETYLKDFLSENIIKDEISALRLGDLLLFNYHEIGKENTFSNRFVAVDLIRDKILLVDTLDKNLVNLIPESFFVKDNLLFLIIDKKRLDVYQIKSE
jgi:hypothetical protein